MVLRKILIPSLAGTSAMTIFSYIVSRSENKNFREPEVLAQLIKRLPINGVKSYAQLTGWVTHYAAGVLFEVLYYELWKRKKTKPSLASGMLLGAASGLAGILAWKVAFVAHPNPPAKKLKAYFSHLMWAHVVFGIFSAMTYKLMVTDKNPRSL